MPCSVLVAFKGIARRAWGRPLAARGWWAQTSQKVNFAYCTDHRPVQPSHIESAINQLCFMKPSTLIYVCLFSSPRSCKQGPSFELSSSVPARAACQGSADSKTSASQSYLKLPFPDKHPARQAWESRARVLLEMTGVLRALHRDPCTCFVSSLSPNMRFRNIRSEFECK